MNGLKPPSQRGCNWADECIEICTGPSVFVQDGGVRATFLNPQRRQIRKIHYDHCYYAGPDRRADFIVGLPRVIDVIVELKGTDTNLKSAAHQVENTLDDWRRDPRRAPAISALIIYGRIEGKKKLPGRVPRTEAVILGLRAEFLKVHRTLLFIHQTGGKKFSLTEFLQ